ncbi:hypothetical protein ACFY0P_22050 [Streptomyces sp. NPDC001714]|uniref:hypothetical protein n=1 Tax=Streptomyces sp. NPDC001714 TaxID=3364603 RepID=UPI0036984CA4
MGTVVGLTFLFGFGNVWALATRLGVPGLVAPLVAPAVDLSVLDLLLAIGYLAVKGAPSEQLRSARRLLILSSLMTLALNISDPLLSGQTGKAAFDAVGPLRLRAPAETRRAHPRQDETPGHHRNPHRGRARHLQQEAVTKSGTDINSRTAHSVGRDAR